MRTVLVTGATGFHGSAVLRALERRTDVAGIGMIRATSAAAAPGRIADLEDARALRAAVEGVDAVVHCASYIGYDADSCRRVNVEGTRRLVAAAAGVPVLYISTTGVYGHAPVDTAGTSGTTAVLAPAPVTVLSASRAEAEKIVLAAGGAVLRPHVVIGRGDTRVMPTLLRIRELLGGLPRDGETRLSAINVRDLGRLAAGLAATRFEGIVGHAVVPRATTIAQLLGLVGRDPGAGVLASDAAERLGAVGVPPSVAAMSMTDEVYDAGDLWEHADIPAPATVRLTHEDEEWYRRG